MNYIINFSNDPNSLTDEQMIELHKALNDAVKNKISRLEEKYDITMKFPPHICNIQKSQTQKIPIPLLPAFISPTPTQINVNAFVPFEMLVENTTDTTNENNIDNLSSCMRIVNSVKRDFELYSSGKKTKEEIDSSFFDWTESDKNETENTVYEHEIDELYAKKFGNKELIKKIIEELEMSNSYTL